MPLVYDDEPGSWGRLSKGWPQYTTRVEAEYHEAWRFCVKEKAIPYGSYVDMSAYDRTISAHVAPFVIRVENTAYRKVLIDHMVEWKVKQAKPTSPKSRPPRTVNGAFLRRPPKRR